MIDFSALQTRTLTLLLVTVCLGTTTAVAQRMDTITRVDGTPVRGKIVKSFKQGLPGRNRGHVQEPDGQFDQVGKVCRGTERFETGKGRARARRPELRRKSAPARR